MCTATHTQKSIFIRKFDINNGVCRSSCWKFENMLWEIGKKIYFSKVKWKGKYGEVPALKSDFREMIEYFAILFFVGYFMVFVWNQRDF